VYNKIYSPAGLHNNVQFQDCVQPPDYFTFDSDDYFTKAVTEIINTDDCNVQVMLTAEAI